MFVLGLNYSQMHDSSACLIRDGQLLFAVAEEGISRFKHDARFPYLAIQACLDFAKLRSIRIRPKVRACGAGIMCFRIPLVDRMPLLLRCPVLHISRVELGLYNAGIMCWTVATFSTMPRP
jgi:hypothetical protein